MTTTTLRYNGKAFIYAPTGLMVQEDEGLSHRDAKEPQLQLAASDAGLSVYERAEKLNGRLAMLGIVALVATEDLLHQGLLQALGL